MTTAIIDGDIESKKVWLDPAGYVRLPTETRKKGYHLHRYLAELTLGRKLKRNEPVHHINYNKSDCRRENLVICQDNSYHRLLHARTDIFNDGYHPDLHAYCTGCKGYHFKEAFPKSKNNWNGLHNICKDQSNSIRRGKKYGKFEWRERMHQQARRAIKRQLASSLVKEGRSL